MSGKPDLPPLPYRNMGVIIGPELHAAITRAYGPEVAASYVLRQPTPASKAPIYIVTHAR